MPVTCSPSLSTASLRAPTSLPDVNPALWAMDRERENRLVDIYNPRRRGRCPFLLTSNYNRTQYTTEMDRYRFAIRYALDPCGCTLSPWGGGNILPVPFYDAQIAPFVDDVGSEK
jgi:hypothetical protein